MTVQEPNNGIFQKRASGDCLSNRLDLHSLEGIGIHNARSGERDCSLAGIGIHNRELAARSKSKPKGNFALILIGAYKLVEAIALLAVAIGLLRYVHRDISEPILHWIHALRIDPGNKYIHRLLAKVFAVSPKQLRELSIGSFVYAGLRVVEGVGLVLRKRWAEYFVIIVTAIFIPLEIYELVQRFTLIRCGLLLGNAAIVWYLIRNLRRR